MHEQGKSQVDIAKIEKYSWCAMQSTIKWFLETSSHTNKICAGRKCVTTKRQDRKHICTSLKDPKKILCARCCSVREIKETVIARVKRRFAEAGQIGYKVRKK